MIDIKFKINGRNLRPNQVGNELERLMLTEVAKQIENRIGRVRCPEHFKHAKVTAQGKSVDKLTFKIEGCCQKLITAVEKKL